jgi:hypothetical protein
MAEYQLTRRIVEVAPDRFLVNVTAASTDLTEPSEYASRLAVGWDRANKLSDRLTHEFRYRIERRGHLVIVEDDQREVLPYRGDGTLQ